MKSKHYPRNFRALVLGGVAALATSGMFEVAVAADAPSIRVSYADLDLSRPGDAQVLYVRLKNASATVCGPEISPRELDQHAAWKKCYTTALHNAVMQIGAPALLARYEDGSSDKHARG